MKYQVFSFHFPDSNPDHKKYNKPDEDYLLVEDNFFAVFDGVGLQYQEPYPNPSPAAKAAAIGASRAVEYLKNNLNSPNKLQLLTDSFDFISGDVRKYNQSLGVTPETVNHLDKQYAATVGAFGFIANDVFYFGQINDCGIIAWDDYGNKELDIAPYHKTVRNYLDSLYSQGKFIKGTKDEHIFIRSEIINNPELFEGKSLNMGVITGDPRAKHFFRYGAYSLLEKGTIILYSDGFVPFIYNTEDFSKLLISESNPDNIANYIKQKTDLEEKFQKEKSLILIKIS